MFHYGSLNTIAVQYASNDGGEKLLVSIVNPLADFELILHVKLSPPIIETA